MTPPPALLTLVKPIPAVLTFQPSRISGSPTLFDEISSRDFAPKDRAARMQQGTKLSSHEISPRRQNGHPRRSGVAK